MCACVEERWKATDQCVCVCGGREVEEEGCVRGGRQAEEVGCVCVCVEGGRLGRRMCACVWVGRQAEEEGCVCACVKGARREG